MLLFITHKSVKYTLIVVYVNAILNLPLTPMERMYKMYPE